eukprot:366573-Chlamydomonas_euryale.AAC.19
MPAVHAFRACQPRMPAAHASRTCQPRMPAARASCAYQQAMPAAHASRACQARMPAVHASRACQPCMPAVHASRACQPRMPAAHASRACQPCMPAVHASRACQLYMPATHASRECQPRMPAAHASRGDGCLRLPCPVAVALRDAGTVQVVRRCHGPAVLRPLTAVPPAQACAPPPRQAYGLQRLPGDGGGYVRLTCQQRVTVQALRPATSGAGTPVRARAAVLKDRWAYFVKAQVWAALCGQCLGHV